MQCNGLKCRCGVSNKWSLRYSSNGAEWILYLECQCGAMHELGKTKNEKISVQEFVSEQQKGTQ